VKTNARFSLTCEKQSLNSKVGDAIAWLRCLQKCLQRCLQHMLQTPQKSREVAWLKLLFFIVIVLFFIVTVDYENQSAGYEKHINLE